MKTEILNLIDSVILDGVEDNEKLLLFSLKNKIHQINNSYNKKYPPIDLVIKNLSKQKLPVDIPLMEPNSIAIKKMITKYESEINSQEALNLSYRNKSDIPGNMKHAPSIIITVLKSVIEDLNKIIAS